MRSSTISIAAVVFLYLQVLLPGCRQTTEGPEWLNTLDYHPGEVFPVTIGKFGFPYLKVRVEGRELEMFFDTANMSGLLIKPGHAEKLGLPVVASGPQYNSDGSVVGTYRVFNIHRLELLGKTWTDVRAHEDWRDDRDGFFGPRFVLGKRFTLDYGHRYLAVSESPLPDRDAAGVSLPMVPSSDNPGMIMVYGSVNGKRVLIQLDTGKSRTCVDRDLAAALKLPSIPHGYRIDAIELGPYSFSVRSAKEVSFMGLSEGLHDPILLGVGSDVLSGILLTVDYPDNTVYIRK